MPKFYGNIGFVKTEETAPGVWTPAETVKQYYGDILKNNRKWDGTTQINEDVNVSNRISIVSDQYAESNFGYLRWVEWMSQKWKVTDVEVAFPRLILTIGGVYNG